MRTRPRCRPERPGPTGKSRILAVILLCCALPAWSGALPGAADGEIFPANPFLGMQVTYVLGGAELAMPVEKQGVVWARTCRGVFSGEALTLTGSSSDLTGTCHAVGGDSFLVLRASIWVDDQRADFSSQNPCDGAEGMTAGQVVNLGRGEFSLTLPVPADASSGGFLVRMTSVRNGTKIDILEVRGILAARGKPLPDLEDPLLGDTLPADRAATDRGKTGPVTPSALEPKKQPDVTSGNSVVAGQPAVGTEPIPGEKPKEAADRLWQEGLALYEQQQFRLALEKLKDSLVAWPDSKRNAYIRKLENELLLNPQRRDPP